MKFIVSSTALSSHLQAISRVINSKNALPILDCFLFELEDGTLSVTVSDSETTMVTTVEVNESDTNGRFAVVAKTLLDALKEIPEQPLTFYVNTDNYEITVQYQNGKYSLMGQNADEFPHHAHPYRPSGPAEEDGSRRHVCNASQEGSHQASGRDCQT